MWLAAIIGYALRGISDGFVLMELECRRACRYMTRFSPSLLSACTWHGTDDPPVPYDLACVHVVAVALDVFSVACSSPVCSGSLLLYIRVCSLDRSRSSAKTPVKTDSRQICDRTISLINHRLVLFLWTSWCLLFFFFLCFLCPVTVERQFLLAAEMVFVRCARSHIQYTICANVFVLFVSVIRR